MSSREEELKAVGRKVKAARIAAELTQAGLAVRVGVSLSTVTRLERGIGKRADLHRLREIARVLRVPVEELLPKEER